MLKEKIVVADVVKKYENPIGELVQVACRFSSDINLLSEGRRINAKSIMGIMAISPCEGMEVDIEANGQDENEAVAAMSSFLRCARA